MQSSKQFLFAYFDLVSLFKGISTFVGYSMPKQPLQNNSRTI